MGQKSVNINGKWIPISDEDFKKVFQPKKDVTTSMFAIGKVVRYTANGIVKMGKIAGADKAGLIFVAPVCNVSRSGYQFSTVQDKVSKQDIMGEVQTTL